jgi:predicted RNase H-like HicB family nuclease
VLSVENDSTPNTFFARILQVVADSFTIVFEKGEQGWWIASIPEIPGAVSQGKTEDEAREMVKDCARELMAFRREEAVSAKGVTKVEQFRIVG